MRLLASKSDTLETQIEFYQGSDLYSYSRITYTFLDYLRDIGGLFGAFQALFGGLVFVLSIDSMYQWITSQVFRVQNVS